MPSGIYERTEETRKRMSIASTGRIQPHRGKPWSEKRRQAQKFVEIKRKRVVRKWKPYKSRNKVYSDDWYEIRKGIYERDDWTCQECGRKCHGKVKIQCHHIDYEITNNDSLNLIILCANCHMKTNFNRRDWVNYLESKVDQHVAKLLGSSP